MFIILVYIYIYIYKCVCVCVCPSVRLTVCVRTSAGEILNHWKRQYLIKY